MLKDNTGELEGTGNLQAKIATITPPTLRSSPTIPMTTLRSRKRLKARMSITPLISVARSSSYSILPKSEGSWLLNQHRQYKKGINSHTMKICLPRYLRSSLLRSSDKYGGYGGIGYYHQGFSQMKKKAYLDCKRTVRA